MLVFICCVIISKIELLLLNNFPDTLHGKRRKEERRILGHTQIHTHTLEGSMAEGRMEVESLEILKIEEYKLKIKINILTNIIEFTFLYM